MTLKTLKVKGKSHPQGKGNPQQGKETLKERMGPRVMGMGIMGHAGGWDEMVRPGLDPHGMKGGPAGTRDRQAGEHSSTR